MVDQADLQKDIIVLAARLNKDMSSKTGFRAWLWLINPNTKLDGKRPIEVFMTDPKSVLEAAKYL